MKKRHFDVETDGFYGAYWKCKTGSDCAMIAMIGDDPEDYLARTSVKWLHKLGVNVMTMSPGKKDYGHHNYPLERIEKAINWLKAHGNQKIGIVGASTTGTLALTAASYFEDITLTIGLTPSDFIWQGFMQGKKDGCKEWPIARQRPCGGGACYADFLISVRFQPSDGRFNPFQRVIMMTIILFARRHGHHIDAQLHQPFHRRTRHVICRVIAQHGNHCTGGTASARPIRAVKSVRINFKRNVFHDLPPDSIFTFWFKYS